MQLLPILRQEAEIPSKLVGSEGPVARSPDDGVCSDNCRSPQRPLMLGAVRQLATTVQDS